MSLQSYNTKPLLYTHRSLSDNLLSTHIQYRSGVSLHDHRIEKTSDLVPNSLMWVFLKLATLGWKEDCISPHWTVEDWKTQLGLTEFLLKDQTIQSAFGSDSMNPWTQPALCQQPYSSWLWWCHEMRSFNTNQLWFKCYHLSECCCWTCASLNDHSCLCSMLSAWWPPQSPDRKTLKCPVRVHLQQVSHFMPLVYTV